MKNIFTNLLFLLVILLAGCKIIAPNISKAITEQQQYEELQKQNTILIDIANSLKTISKCCQNKCIN